MSLEIRQSKLRDRPAIARFIDEAYGLQAEYKAEDRWSWQFRDNPFSTMPDGNAPVWVALDGGRVVGQIAVQETDFKIGNELHRGGWIVDVMVLPEYRGQGLGHRLHADIPGAIPLLLTLTMAPATRRIAEKARCVTLGPVYQYTKWLRLGADAVRRYLVVRTHHRPKYNRIAQAMCRYFAAHYLLAWAGNMSVWVREWISRNAKLRKTCEICEVPSFDEDVDRLWLKVSSQFRALVPRTARFLNWRFVDCPRLAYRRFVALVEGEIAGYAVLRKCEPYELPAGEIVDVFAARDDVKTIRALLVHAVELFQGEVAVVNCATSLPEITSELRRLGFFVTRTMRPTAVADDPVLRQKLERSKDHWHFTKADHDWDQIHLA